MTQTVQWPASGSIRIANFQPTEGDLIRISAVDGILAGKLLAWVGAVPAEFDDMESSSNNWEDPRFLEVCTVHDAQSNELRVYLRDSGNPYPGDWKLKIILEGVAALGVENFSAGTFTTVRGTTGADAELVLTEDADRAFGLAGNDTLDGLAGNDTLNGDGGDDVMSGGEGGDLLYGGKGDDFLDGGAGADVLRGGGGVDTLHGGDGDDTLLAGGARDSTTTWSDPDPEGTVNALFGGAGNDSLLGAEGDDWLEGGADDDTLDGGFGNDLLWGDDGADRLVGNMGDDTLDGGAGNDTLLGGGSVYWSPGNDHLSGGEGDDVLYSEGGEVTMQGGAGADRFVFTNASTDQAREGSSILNEWYTTVSSSGTILDFDAAQGDRIRSGVTNGRDAGVPLLWRGAVQGDFTATLGESLAGTGAAADDARYYEFWVAPGAEEGTSVLFLDRNRNFIVDADDFRLVFGGNAMLDANSFTSGTFVARRGSDGADNASTLPFTASADYLLGMKGNDTLFGGAGDDRLVGHQGNDVLSGDAGVDTMSGDAGNDTYYIDNVRDDIAGESSAASGGIDTVITSIDWSAASDYVENLVAAKGTAAIDLTGNKAVNVLTGNDGNNVLDGRAGADKMAGGKGNDTYYVDNTKDNITGESSSASSGIDKVFSSVTFSIASDYVEHLTLTGSAHINGTGNALANLITGNSGKNVLNGGSGKDTLDGGSGADTLTGGSSADRFVYDKASDSTLKALDRITDFTRGSDKIDLSHLDGNAGKSGHQDFKFIGSKAFSADATGQLRFAVESGKVMLYGSTDADAAAEFAVEISGLKTLAASDFLF